MNEIEKSTAIHIKEQRRQIDLLVKSIDHRRELDDDGIELPLILSGIAAKDAFMWLGKASKFLGSVNPYPNSTDASNSIVEPAQDVQNGVMFEDIDDTIIWLKAVRNNIDEIEVHLKTNLQLLTDMGHRFFQLSAAQAWIRLNDCKHSLGLAMRKIADAKAEEERESAADQPAPAEEASDASGELGEEPKKDDTQGADLGPAAKDAGESPVKEEPVNGDADMSISKKEEPADLPPSPPPAAETKVEENAAPQKAKATPGPKVKNKGK